ncbi:hypothetical protein ONZ45_g13749 [Pleurotus djamor]|nr:hypothetical protein ONZ45_g13749 [Pleurotus djamor]
MANFELFPTPAQAPSAIAPFRWAGISPESTLAMQETLKENHEKYHVFFNDRGFHNHTAHAVLAAWALGANGTIIRAAYEHSAVYQRPAYKSPEPITSQNVFDHLGDEKYYNSYLTFFKEELQAKGFSPVLEDYVFSAKANHGSPSKPQMLNRFLAGLLHPLIHTGYGAELGLPGLVAEGLAQTAVHGAEAPSLTPPSMFENLDPTESLTSRLASVLSLNEKPSTKSSKPNGVHALTLVNRVLNDPQFKVAERGPNALESVLEKHSEAIIDLVKDWIVDTSDPQGVEKKIHEIALTNSLLYGVAGWNKDSHFIADFFLYVFHTMSLLT